MNELIMYGFTHVHNAHLMVSIKHAAAFIISNGIYFSKEY